MKHRHKELGEPFFSWRLEAWGKNVVSFPRGQTVQPYVAHKSEGAFHEPRKPLQRVHERYNTDVTQMIF